MSDNNLQAQLDATVQSLTRRSDFPAAGILFWMATAGQIISPWWSRARDNELRAFWKSSDHLSGGYWMIATKLMSVPFQIIPKDLSIKGHVKQADMYQSLLEDWVQFGGGWQELWGPALIDLWSQDNGMFLEVIGGGNPSGPIKGPAYGLSHLDASRCTRTSNPEYPVQYQDIDGKLYRFHYSRVIFRSQMPSPAAQMNRVGHCWATRCINKTQELIDQSVYKQEKLGSRPLRGILKGKGIDTDQIIEAVAMAEEGMDSQGLTRFAKMVVVGSLNTDFDIEMLDLASLPEGFNERTSTELAMFVIALAGGFPPRWLWPAMTVGATRADAMYQHIAGSGGGASWHLNMIKRELEQKFLPDYLIASFDFQDDEQDRLQADIRNTRAETRQADLDSQVVDVRVARQQAMRAGDLDKAQYEYLELRDGRLINGDDVISLFHSSDRIHRRYLDIGIEDPLNVYENNRDKIISKVWEAKSKLNAELPDISQSFRPRAIQSFYALEALLKLYEESEQPSLEVIEEEEIIEEEPMEGGEEIIEEEEENELSSEEV